MSKSAGQGAREGERDWDTKRGKTRDDNKDERRVKGVRKSGEREGDHFSSSSGRREALPRPSRLSLGRPCSPLSALGERKRTKDLLLGPDLYTFLVLFFSPRPLGHTKGL